MISDTITILTDSTLVETVHLVANDTLIIKIQHCTTTSAVQSTILDYVIKNGITLVIALIAGTLALFQVKSNVIATARIKRMEELRANLSGLNNSTLDTILHYTNAKNTTGQNRLDHYSKYSKCHSKYNYLSSIIKMQLDSSKANHVQIENLIDEIDSMISPNNINNYQAASFNDKLNKIVKIAKQIFKEEWKCSKRIWKL